MNQPESNSNSTKKFKKIVSANQRDPQLSPIESQMYNEGLDSTIKAEKYNNNNKTVIHSKRQPGTISDNGQDSDPDDLHR